MVGFALVKGKIVEADKYIYDLSCTWWLPLAIGIEWPWLALLDHLTLLAQMSADITFLPS